MDGLDLPHQKAEALAPCTCKANACLWDLVYKMYLSRMSAQENVPVHDGINGRITQNTIIKGRTTGTQNGSRVEPPGDLLRMAVWLQKSKGYRFYRLLYQRNLVDDIGEYMCHLHI